MTWLSGYKTYITAGIGLLVHLVVVAGYLTPQAELKIDGFLGPAALVFLRMGVEKMAERVIEASK